MLWREHGYEDGISGKGSREVRLQAFLLPVRKRAHRKKVPLNEPLRNVGLW